jgi:hypothetical protein
MIRRRSCGDHFQKAEKDRHVFGGDNLMAKNGNRVFSQTIDVHCCQLSPGNEQYLQSRPSSWLHRSAISYYSSAPVPSCRVRLASKVVLRSCISLSFLGHAGLSSVQSTDCHAATPFWSLFMTSCFPSFPHSSSHSHLFHYRI